MSDKRLMRKKRSKIPVENIIAHYMDERSIELSEKEKELQKRCESIYKKLIQKDSILDAIKVHMRFFKVSQATTYRDIRLAQQIFGPANKFDKNFWRFIQIERKRNMINRARIAGELEIEAKLERDIDNLLDFDKDESKFNPEKLMAMSVEISLSEHTINQIKKLSSKGVVDLNEFETEEIEYTEVKDEEEGTA